MWRFEVVVVIAPDDIVCLICGVKFRTLGSHLRRRHSMSTFEYLKSFPTAKTISSSMRAVFSVATQRVRDADSSISQRVSETMINNYQSDSTIGRRISQTLLQTYAENDALHERLSRSHVGLVHSEATRRLLSVRAQERWGNDTYARTQSEVIAKARRDDPKIGQKISRALLGHEVSDETRQLLSKANAGREVAESVRLSTSKSMIKRWEDPEYVQHVFDGMIRSKGRGPNGSELRLLNILGRYFPNVFSCVGDFKLWVGRHNPDFVDTLGLHLIVEMFGEFSHNPLFFPNRLSESELIEYYAHRGFKCVVLWEYIVWCDEPKVLRDIKGLLATAGVQDPTIYE